MRAKKEVRDKWEREREAGKGVVGWLKGAVGGLVKVRSFVGVWVWVVWD